MNGTEQDISNFSTSSSHRLPTISAAEALQSGSKVSTAIPTNLPSLDSPQNPADTSPSPGLVRRGYLTEIYGPPGVGKTAFGLQLIINTICAHCSLDHVVWIDTGSPLALERLNELIRAYKVPDGQPIPSSPPEPWPVDELSSRLTYLNIQSLPHFLTLFIHPSPSFPPPETTLIVVDTLSSLVLETFPKGSLIRQTRLLQNGARKKQQQKAAIRKWAILASLATAMGKMAAIKNIAIVAINQTTTSLRDLEKASLRPALSIEAWDAAVHTRILLYRDFAPHDMAEDLSEDETSSLRFAATTKLNGKALSNLHAVSFVIENAGLREMKQSVPLILSSEILGSSSPSPALFSIDGREPCKRKAFEIADSEDEDEDLEEESDEGFMMGSGGEKQADVRMQQSGMGDPSSRVENADEDADEDEDDQPTLTPFQDISDGELTHSDADPDPD